jgi:N-acetylmuramic acid 6-phosphate etherase
MIKIGRVQGNRMVNMQLSNDKLIERGTKMVSTLTGLDEERARKLLLEKGNVKAAADFYNGSEW